MKRSVHRLLCAVLGCILLLGVLAGANTAMAETAASGKCGKDLVWTFDPATGVITIEGEGAMWDYDSAKLLPWAAYASNIKKVVIKSGVTSLGRNAFSGCAVEEVEFADTLEAIGQNAFRNCENLAAVDLTNTKVQTIAAGAFVGCEKLTTDAVKLPETVVSVSATAFEEKVGVKAEEVKQAPAEAEAPAEPMETPKTWTEEMYGMKLECTLMPDGTVSVSCYEDGTLLYTSVRTYGDGGKVHEEYLYPDGSTAVEDRVEDENGNYLSGASMWYDENGVFFQKTVFKIEDGVEYTSNYNADGSLSFESARVSNADGTYTEKSKSYSDDGSTTVSETLLDRNLNEVKTTYYLEDSQNNTTITGTRTRNEDGSYTEKETQNFDDGSTEVRERLLDSKMNEVKTTYYREDSQNNITVTGTRTRNEDGSYTEKETENFDDGATEVRERLLDSKMNEVKTTYHYTDNKNQVTKNGTITHNEDGTITEEMTQVDIDGTTINKVTMDANYELIRSSYTRTNNDSSVCTGEEFIKDGLRTNKVTVTAADGTVTVESTVQDCKTDKIRKSEMQRLAKDGTVIETYLKTCDDNGKFHREYRYPDGMFAVKDGMEDDNGNQLSGVEMIYDATGNLVQKSVSKTENGVFSQSDYNAAGDLYGELSRVSNGDGTFTEKRKTTDDNGSVSQEESLLDSSMNEVTTRYKYTDQAANVTREGTRTRNQDGTFTEVDTQKDSGGTMTSNRKLDANRQLIYSTYTRKNNDASVSTGEEFVKDGLLTNKSTTTAADGTVNTGNTVLDLQTNKLKSLYNETTVNGQLVQKNSTVWNNDGTHTDVVEDQNSTITTVRGEDGKEKSSTSINKTTGERIENTYDADGTQHTKVYDKDNKLTYDSDAPASNNSAATMLLPKEDQKPVTADAPDKEKSTEEKSTEEKSTEEKSTEEKSTEEKPSEEKPSEEKPTEEKPTEEKPSEEKPDEEKPSEEKPDEEKPTEEKPSEEKPDEEKPSEEKPSEEKPSEEKPSEEKPTEEQPTEEKPTEEEPTQEQPAEQPKGESEAAVLPAVGEKIAVEIAA